LSYITSLIIGSESEQQSDIVLAQLSQEMYNTGLLLLLIRNLHRIDFEGKKDVAQIFNSVLRRSIGTRTPTVEYICTTPEILFSLCKGIRRFLYFYKF
jgi:calcium binding protein 39